jgi:release factor glutamine methyltransferase
LQYITGETEFCGLKFAVDRRVLIPRPETELLVETVLRQITNHQSLITIIDVGTGSGCIAVALAMKLPGAEVTAIDASEDALAVAESNAKRHGVEKKIRFLKSDLLDGLPSSLRADVIVSNPPYIASGDWAELPKEVRDFEPVQALVAGEDGLEIFRRLAMTAGRVLTPDGFVALELGAGQRPAVEELFGKENFAVSDVVKDLQGHERVIVARAKK